MGLTRKDGKPMSRDERVVAYMTILNLSKEDAELHVDIEDGRFTGDVVGVAPRYLDELRPASKSDS